MADDVYYGTPRNGRRRFSNPTSVKSFISGTGTVGTTAAAVLGNNGSGAGIAYELNSGVRIKADSGNTQDIFVCSDSSGTTSSGFGLGELFIDIDDLNKVFLISHGGGMTARFIGS
jgi:hypothetical protein